MRILEKSRKRVLVYVVFVVAFVRMVLARILPPETVAAGLHQPSKGSKIRGGLMLRFGDKAQPQAARQFAIEATGRFPFVRLVSVSRTPVPVPFELASLSTLSSPAPDNSKLAAGLHRAKRPATGLSRSRQAQQKQNLKPEHALVHKAKSSGDDPFCVVACDSCSSCGGCGSCASCASCTPTSCTPTSCCPTSCGPNSCGPNSCCTTTTTTTTSCGSSSCCP